VGCLVQVFEGGLSTYPKGKEDIGPSGKNGGLWGGLAFWFAGLTLILQWSGGEEGAKTNNRKTQELSLAGQKDPR